MKKIFLACLLYSAGSPFCHGQDLQWLVKNFNGKENNTYPNANAITTNEFTLEAIKHPNCQCNSKARNDIFVIYDNWSHYNSRLDLVPTISGFFYPPNPADLNHTKHNMRVPVGRKPMYLYLSNIYEDDDLPPPVLAKSGFSGSNSIPYIMGTTNTPIPITANHDVIQGADITLVIKGATITEGATLQFKVKALATASVTPSGSYFSGSTIFDGKFISAGNLIPLSGGVGYKFTDLPIPTPDYIYINLKPTSSLLPYYPNVQNSSTPTHKAIFEVRAGNGNLNAEGAEDIIHSHDPNFMQLAALCRDNFEDLYASLHIEFENTSATPANNLKIRILLPSDLDPTTIGLVKWKAGTNTTPGTMIINKQEVIFVFPENSSVLSCDLDKDPLSENAKGSVDFCVQIRDNAKDKFGKRGLSPKPASTRVYFGKDEYVVDKLMQPFTTKGIPIDIANVCDCSSPYKWVKVKIPEYKIKVYVPEQDVKMLLKVYKQP